MRRTFARITLAAAAALGLAATSYVQALGLGEINVNSDLNQRFVASIPLTEISAEDLETVTVSIAPNEAFDRAGIERAEYLSSLNFEIKNDGGRPRVVVTSSQIAREPVLNILVQARWSGGKILREYTVLLDPPTAVATRPAPAPVAPPVIAPAPTSSAPVIAPAPAPAKPAPAKPVVPVGGEFYETPTETKPGRKPASSAPVVAPAPAATDDAYDSATGSYGPVAPKETLWSIATKVRPNPRVSMDQVLLALAEANPVAIQRGTTVSKGVTLRVPSAERVQSVSPEAAKARLLALRGGKSITPKTQTAAPKSAAPEIVTRPEPATAPAPALAVSTPKSAEPAASKPAAPVVATPSDAKPAAPATAAPTPAAPATVAPTAPAPTSASTPAAADSAATAPSTTAPTAPATTDTTPAAPAATAPDTALALPATTGSAPAKSPLAQPLDEEASPGFIDEYGLPLGVLLLVLLLAAVLLVLSGRRKKAAIGKNNTPAFKPGDTSSVFAPTGGAGALGKLGDAPRVNDTQAFTPREAAAGVGMDGTQQLTQPVRAAPTVEAHQSTLILDPEAAATLNNSVKSSAVTSGGNFDKTTQVQVDALNINLGDNDPLSEADFHLAYGLYDEAILLLKTATQQQPQRTDLKVKLAETYFAAGRPMEFQETAEDLKDKLSPGEWSKLAIMGSQICPDVALFQSGDADAGLDADFDLLFDEPASPAPAPTPAAASNNIEFELSSPALLSAPAPAPVVPPLMSNELKFKLDEELDEDDRDSSKKALPPAGLDDDASIDFMLGQSLTPLGAGTRIPSGSDLGFNLGSPSLNVPLPKVDITRGADPSASLVSDRPTLTPSAGSALSLSLQDLEVSITPRQATAESAEDELNTKLDLARAYVEMGDNDMARSLLQEVQEQGGERHKQEAASLLQRLPA